MKKINKVNRGFTLVEVSLALILSAMVGYAAVRQVTADATKQAAYAYGTQLNQLRKAMDAYVAAYRDNIANNTPIAVGTATAAGATAASISCLEAGTLGTVRCPSADTLIALKLLPAGFRTTGLSGGQAMAICGFDPTLPWGRSTTSPSDNPASRVCKPLMPSCVGNACDISGMVIYANPFKQFGDSLNAAAFDGDAVMHVLEKTEDRGAFSRDPNTNLRRIGDSPIFVPNVHQNAPSGMVAAVFSTTASAVTQRAGYDFCPGSDLYFDYVQNRATFQIREGSATGRVLVPGTDYGTASAGTLAKGGGNDSCQQNFVFTDTLVGSSSGGAGYKTSGNNTGLVQVACVRNATTGKALPSYNLLSCQ